MIATAVHQPALEPYVREEPLSCDDIAAIRGLLHEHKTLNIDAGRIAATGLYSAGLAGGDNAGTDDVTGYRNVWIRDSIFLAHAFYSTDPVGEGAKKAVEICGGIAKFLLKSSHRFRDCIAGVADVNDPMQRPHIRFDGERLQESSEFWNHKQNDALGYFVWMLCRLGADGRMPVEDYIGLVELIFSYLKAIRFWQDEDNGHWEEAVKVEASSIGPVVAAIREFKRLCAERPQLSNPGLDDVAQSLEEEGKLALSQILPDECVQPGKERRADGALIFLVYPLGVAGEHSQAILDRIECDITGPIGIRRYNGDSYWCKDYKDLTGKDATKAYTDEEMQERDKLSKAGEEAQWCIFDPMVSCAYGERYLQSRNPSDLKRQQRHLVRALAHITGPDCEHGAWYAPESYYLRGEEWVPSDITPLLWTEANLLDALHMMEMSVAVAAN